MRQCVRSAHTGMMMQCTIRCQYQRSLALHSCVRSNRSVIMRCMAAVAEYVATVARRSGRSTPMGAHLVGMVLASWSHVPDRAFRVLVRMAHTALDAAKEDQPSERYFG